MTRRSWIATCRYPGLTEFIFGTVFTDRDEGEEAGQRKILALMDQEWSGRLLARYSESS